MASVPANGLSPLWSNFLCVLVPLTVNFKVIGPDHPIMVSAGQDALLPCHLFPNTSAQEMEVRWYRSKFSEPVHLYQNEKDQAEQQIPNYQGRTELLKDGIVDGSVVLRIRNITPSDHGQFICFFRSHSFYEEATLELKVTGQMSPLNVTPHCRLHRDRQLLARGLPGKAPSRPGQFVYLPRLQLWPIAAPTGRGSPSKANGGCGKGGQHIPQAAPLPAAPIGLGQ
uniref:Ig-like domain-containing protein n=1 Tax=Chrysemys picta bellii TaxID=8478 RepID=A0A8C3FI76_CHRPI